MGELGTAGPVSSGVVWCWCSSGAVLLGRHGVAWCVPVVVCVSFGWSPAFSSLALWIILQKAAADTSDIVICATAGTSVHFTDTFKHLGSMLTRDLKSNLDIEFETRLTLATQAFGTLRPVACNRHSTSRCHLQSNGNFAPAARGGKMVTHREAHACTNHLPPELEMHACNVQCQPATNAQLQDQDSNAGRQARRRPHRSMLPPPFVWLGRRSASHANGPSTT